MHDFSFQPIEPLATKTAAMREAERWIHQPELLKLCSDFGFHANLLNDNLGDFVSRLAAFSDVWDFRKGTERDAVGGSERVYELEQLVKYCRNMGLVDPIVPREKEYEHLIVLGGTLLSCHERVAFASSLIMSGDVNVNHVWLLGTDRPPSDAERLAAEGLSSNIATSLSEFSALVRCAESFFHVESWIDATGPEKDDISRSAVASLGCQVHVLGAAPRSRQRRANTEDTYEQFLSLSHAGAGDRTLICTSQIYVPFQYFGAIRTLGITAGVPVDMSGYDSTGGFAGATDQVLVKRYLQETRSAILAVRNLLSQIGVVGNAN